MKKIKLLLGLPLILAFLLLAKVSFAQTAAPDVVTYNPLFDMSKTAATSFIQYGEPQAKRIDIFPFTTVIVPPNSFKDNVTVNIYQGNWDKIKAVLPKDESPISSYYIVFINSKSKMVLPSNPITIQSYNNFTGTDTFFYPIGAIGNIDVANAKKWPGHIFVNTPLPIQDSAFIVSANKLLQKSDPSLNPPSPNTTVSQPAAAPSVSTQKTIALVFLIFTALLLMFLLWNNNKKLQRRRK